MEAINRQGNRGNLAYTELKNKILTVEGGTYLSARQFASEIGMSYTPVREAFLRLQSEGTLKQVPGVGYFVATMDINDMLQAFQVRECIEPFVLQRVFTHIKPEDIERMRESIETQKEALAAGDIPKYMKLDITLHEVPMEVYGNHHLKSAYHTIREKYMYCSNRIALTFSPNAIDEHTAMVCSIEAGDLELSLKLLSDNIENAKQRMMDGYINVV